MSTLEIKGGLLDLISSIKDKEMLLKVNEIIKDLIKSDEPDWWDDLPAKVQEEIDKTLTEIEDESNLISHEEVMKKSKRWSKK